MPHHFTPLPRPGDTQAAMLHSLRRWLGEQAPFKRRAGLLASPLAIEPLWRGLHADLGLLGAGQLRRVAAVAGI